MQLKKYNRKMINHALQKIKNELHNILSLDISSMYEYHRIKYETLLLEYMMLGGK